MTNNLLNPNQPPVISTPPAKKGIQHYVQLFVDIIKSSVIILFWAIIGCAALSITVIAVMAIIWASQLVLRALGG